VDTVGVDESFGAEIDSASICKWRRHICAADRYMLGYLQPGCSSSGFWNMRKSLRQHFAFAFWNHSSMILARGHTTIRRPHRSIDNLCGVRTQEQGYLGDFVDVAYGLLTYVRIWRDMVSSVKTAGKNQT
jgi:hypothetical protein